MIPQRNPEDTAISTAVPQRNGGARSSIPINPQRIPSLEQSAAAVVYLHLKYVQRAMALKCVDSIEREFLDQTHSLPGANLNRRTVLLRFSSENDCRRAWLRNQMLIADNRMWMSRWMPEQIVYPNRDSPLTLVWLQLPLLPIHLFNFDMLSRICEPIGRLVELGSATVRRTRPNMARVKIEIDVSKSVFDCIWIEFGEGGGLDGFWQKVEVERLPNFCIVCGRFGHLVGNCKQLR
ncbi:PREDICTED: uncharacterized protein LOC109191761 [Ipomoea nil]|uniref:uncharacterized protein LOC109191761 n=1 Tax=Ipomoea nil TaxID=35883 RepID=UPI000901369E|nr:PREDICTED: uncharacterized protein LOC109191761 [Ipomoea nil]